MELLPKTITWPVGRARSRGAECARGRALRRPPTDEEPSPYDLVSEHRVYGLRHYFPDGNGGPPVLLVPPVMLAAEIYDVSPSTSAVSTMHEHGADGSGR